MLNNSSEENCTAVGDFIFYVESQLLHKKRLHNANTTLTISECNVFIGQRVEGPNINVNIFTYGFNPMFMAVGVTVAFSQQSFFVDICIRQSNFSAVDFNQGNGLLLLYVFRELMSKVTIDNKCIFKGLVLDVQFYFRTDFVTLKNMAGCSSATVCAAEIKNSTFQNTTIYIHIPLSQQDLTNNYNLPKVSLNDDRILNSAVITNAESGRGNFIVEMNNVQFLCSNYESVYYSGYRGHSFV